MKTPDQSESITRWLDGTMSAAEKAAFQEKMQQDPVLRSEVSSLEKLGRMVRGNAMFEKPVPNPDFFNAQIQDRIFELQRAEERRKSPAGAGSWLSWWRAPLALAAAAALLAVGLFVTLRGDKPQTQVLGLYVPNPAVKASVKYNAEAQATVLSLEGLSDLPADKVISGLHVHHSDTDLEMASTTLYDDRGKVLLVMATDAGNRPVLLQ